MMPSTVAASIESAVMSASVKTAVVMTSTRIVMVGVVGVVMAVMRTAGIRPSQISGHPHSAVGPIKTPAAMLSETAQASRQNCNHSHEETKDENCYN